MIDEQHKKFGKYQILRELGRGGMGVVYLATDNSLGREVAVKVIRPGLSLKSSSIAHFKSEARATAGLNHPNIVHINTFDEVNGSFLIEMPFLAGGSLRDHMRNGLSLSSVVSIFRSMLKALDCCHIAGIVHRDVKPSNIIFDENQVPMLGDFGIATLIADEFTEELSQVGTVSFSGTPKYSCPESWNGDQPSPAWDLYALGIIVWEMIAGELPYGDLPPLAFMRKISETPMPLLADQNPGVSKELCSLVDALCAFDVDDRITSAQEALILLAKTPEINELSDADETVTLPSLPWMKKINNRKRRILQNKWLKASKIWLLTVLLIGILSGFVFEAMSNSNQAERSSGKSITDPLATQFEKSYEQVLDLGILESLERGPTVGLSSVYDVRTPNDPQVNNQLLLYREALDGDPRLLGKMGPYLVSMVLLPSGENTYSMTGMWGGFVGEFLQQAVHGTLSGKVDWNGDLNAPFWIALDYRGYSIPDGWSHVLLGAPAKNRVTDTSFLIALENDPVAMPILFRDLSYWYPKLSEGTFYILPALAEMTFTSPILSSSQDLIDVDGKMDEAIWSDSSCSWLMGNPRNVNSAVAIAVDESRLFIGLKAPDVDLSGVQVHVSIMPKYANIQTRSPYLEAFFRLDDTTAQWVEGDTKTPINSPHPFRMYRDEHTNGLELSIPLAFLHVESPIAPKERYRVNIALENLDGSLLVQWGWSEVAGVSHGAIVEFVKN